MVFISSSAISAVNYDVSTRVMLITFKSGRTYPFCGVPEVVYEGLKNATSAGRYYHRNVKGRYDCC